MRAFVPIRGVEFEELGCTWPNGAGDTLLSTEAGDELDRIVEIASGICSKDAEESCVLCRLIDFCFSIIFGKSCDGY